MQLTATDEIAEFQRSVGRCHFVIQSYRASHGRFHLWFFDARSKRFHIYLDRCYDLQLRGRVVGDWSLTVSDAPGEGKEPGHTVSAEDASFRAMGVGMVLTDHALGVSPSYGHVVAVISGIVRRLANAACDASTRDRALAALADLTLASSLPSEPTPAQVEQLFRAFARDFPALAPPETDLSGLGMGFT